jgi:hypothetical protein
MSFLRILPALGTFAFAWILPAFAEPAPADEINAVVSRFKVEFDALAAAEDASMAPAKAAYVKEVERLRDTARAKGDLGAALDMETTLKALQQNLEPPPAKVAGAALAMASGNFERGKAQALRLTDAKRKRLEADFARALTDFEQRFTRSGKLEAARSARAAKLTIPWIAVDVLPMMIGQREVKEGFVAFKDEEGLRTEMAFQPPIEIQYVLKTDSQVRPGFAAAQIIFNWEVNRSELRIEGGPVGGQHRPGVGGIPTKQLINIKQVVLPDVMSVAVDGHERTRWQADFRGVNEPITVRGTHGATVQLRQVLVRKLR